MISDDLLHDPNYQDYRELICYERPASIFLHFEHGLHHLPLLLFDRILLEKNNGKITGVENRFARFLEDHRVVQELRIEAHDADALWGKLQALWIEDPDSVLLMTYFNRVSGELLLSTWIIESLFCVSTRRISLTSLRGDDFFVRKESDFDNVFHKLYQENSVYDLKVLRFPSSLKKLGQLSSEEFIDQHQIDAAIDEISRKISCLRLDGKSSSVELLIQEVESWQLNNEDLGEKVRNGYKNVLLVKFFWPIQFHYKPFLVFVKHYLQAKKIEDAEIQILLESTKELTEIVVALSQKFGLTCNSKILGQFRENFLSLLHQTLRIEDLFFTRFTPKKDYRVKGVSLHSRVLKDLLGPSRVHITSQYSNAPLLCLDDASAMAAPDSGYMDKIAVRECLRGGEFEVKYQAVESPEQVKQWKFPFIMKTSLGWGSCQVYRVTNDEQACKAYEDIDRFHRIFFSSNQHAKVMIEEELSGVEYAAELVNVNGVYETIGIFEKMPIDEAFLLDHTYILNGEKQKLLWGRFRTSLAKICETLKTSAPFLHIEFRYDATTHRLGIIEVNFRMGGGGLLSWLVFKSNCYAFLNPQSKFFPEWQSGIFADLIPRVEGHGLIREIHGKEQIESHPAHLVSVWTKNRGDYYTPPPRGFDYPVQILSRQKSEDEFFDFITFVESTLRFDYE